MNLLSQLAEGVSVGVQPASLLLIVVGLFVGVLVGAAPGIGQTVGLVLVLPVALTLTPEQAIILFTAILVGSSFGNSIPAVLLNVPGTSSAILTCIEGHPFQQRGEGGRALMVCLVSSIVGQFFSVFVFILFVVPLSAIAVKLLFPEMFAIIVLGLLVTAGLVNGQLLKGLVAVAIGLTLASVGPDPITAGSRLTFGIPRLQQGLHTVPVIVGLLALRQLIRAAGEVAVRPATNAGLSLRSLRVRWLSREDRKEIRGPIALGAVLGTGIGIMPGAGGTVASFISYQAMRSISKDKSEFGRGTGVRGLAAVDSSNNSVNGGELIPTLGLGIPGAPAMVVVMAVLSAQGLVPGPRLLETRPGLLFATFGGLFVSTLLLGLIGYLTIGPSVFLASISPAATHVVTSALVIVGVYSLRWSLFDVFTALIIGVCAFLLEKNGYPPAPIALAFVLGGIMESSLRRGLIMTFGPAGFFSRPAVVGIFGVALVFMLASMFISRWGKRRLSSDPSARLARPEHEPHH